jgi:hypothetical protein
VGSSFSAPSTWVQRKTRICADSGRVPSLRREIVAAAPGAGIWSVTGATCSEAATAGFVRNANTPEIRNAAR